MNMGARSYEISSFAKVGDCFTMHAQRSIRTGLRFADTLASSPAGQLSVNKRQLLQASFAAGAAAILAAPALAQTKANVRWRLASSFPEGLDTIYGGAKVLAKRVAANAGTGGKFQISVQVAG
jgi:hypothetical protein